MISADLNSWEIGKDEEFIKKIDDSLTDILIDQHVILQNYQYTRSAQRRQGSKNRQEDKVVINSTINSEDRTPHKSRFFTYKNDL